MRSFTPGDSRSESAAASISNECVIDAMLALWTGVPDQRFGQLVMNLSRIEGGFADTWEWSNADWLRKIEEAMRTWAKVPS